VAFVVIAAVVVAQAVGLVWARLAGILFGLLAGYLVCALSGWLTPPVPVAHWLTLPHFFPHGLAFRWDLYLPFVFIYLVSLLESLGDMTATTQLSGLETSGPVHAARLRAGLLADGVTSIFAAVIGSFPSTGVASRHIGKWMALIMILLGLLPAVSGWVTAMPPAVLGGMALLLFGLVSVSGLRLIVGRHLSHRNGLIAALALGVGLGAPSQPDWIAHLPAVLRSLLESGISAGGIVAIVLNLVLPGGQLPAADA
jgi:NCS2 family nucleobase:cation symporter-2/xanthine permease XanP